MLRCDRERRMAVKRAKVSAVVDNATPMDATPFIPAHGTLAMLRRTVNECRGCPLYAQATQGVLGEGPARAELMLVGEQPGDQEDLQGRPFVGPAGKLLDRALA